MLALGANTHRPTVGSRCIRKESRMFIAMNRFRVKKGSEEAFEKVWLSRDTHLAKVPGFVEFHLLKGPEHEDFTLYASHSVWQSRGGVRSLDEISRIPLRPQGCGPEQAALHRPSGIGRLRGAPNRQAGRDRGRLASTGFGRIHIDDLRGAAPDLPRHLDHPRKLRPLDALRHRDVLGGTGRESALRAQAQLLELDVAACLLDAALEKIDAL